MNQMRVVFCFDVEDFFSPEERPLMLETVLFCPILRWMGVQMKDDGVKRFFVMCPDAYAKEAAACFDAEDDVVVSASKTDLMEFLREDGPVTVFPCAQVPLELPGGSGYAYTAEAADLRAAWVDEIGGGTFCSEKRTGWTAVYRHSLSDTELACRDALVKEHMKNGVRVLDPGAVYVDPRVTIGRGTVILPGTILRGRTVIGRDCEIGPNAMIRDCTVGDCTEINASQMTESVVGSHTTVGPFAYLRPNSRVGDHVKVGDFVEVKNSVIGNGTKISHLTYVGDSDVGEKVNFGCGTVTTNYDGHRKYRCTIGDNAFLGCNTNLVAPVTIGEGAYTAAGSTITKDVPADALALARTPQTVKEGWAARRRRMYAKKDS